MTPFFNPSTEHDVTRPQSKKGNLDLDFICGTKCSGWSSKLKEHNAGDTILNFYTYLTA